LGLERGVETLGLQEYTKKEHFAALSRRGERSLPL
jgi:hypothetical protein